MKRISYIQNKISWLLWPLSLLYRCVIYYRNRCYDLGICKTIDVGIPVISVGNISVGGSGKTPLVEHLARDFVQRGITPAIISRGYKRESHGQVVVSEGNGPIVSVADAGDEPYMLSMLVPGAIVIVNTNRVAAAKTAQNEYHADVIVMDDGFQHRRLQRNSDVVILPLEDLLKKKQLLPAGHLRENYTALTRATQIAITISNGNNPDWKRVETFLRKHTSAPVYRYIKKTHPTLHNPVTGNIIDLRNLPEIPAIHIVAGIGNSTNFLDALKQLPIDIVEIQTFPDHFRYPPESQQKILERFRHNSACYLVMTAKDFVKWDKNLISDDSIYFMTPDIQLQPQLAEDLFRELSFDTDRA